MIKDIRHTHLIKNKEDEKEYCRLVEESRKICKGGGSHLVTLPETYLKIKKWRNGDRVKITNLDTK